MSDPGFLRRGASGVTVDLRVQPRARRAGLAMAGDTLKAAVTAPPEDGKANAALIALIAKTAGRPASSVRIVSGHTARTKILEIDGFDAAGLAAAFGEPA